MRYAPLILVSFLAACSASAAPEVAPAPRQEPFVVPPVSADDAPPVPPPPPGAEAAPGKPWRGPVTYRCAGDRVIETKYADDGTVEVRWNGRWYTLRQEPAGSGALYAGSSLRWHTKGNSALLEERGQTVASECTVR